MSEKISAAHAPSASGSILGARGTTRPCVEAMVTILTSPYPPREITVLFCDEHPGEHPGEHLVDRENKHYAASFVVWDWLREGITIVPDGFGTHAGTGRWGLRFVLNLIEFYQIPLKEEWFEDVKQFERINEGKLTERDRKALYEPEYFAPGWPEYASECRKNLWHDAGRDVAQSFPFWLLEPEIVEYAKGIGKDADNVVFRAVKRLEVIIRELGGFDAHLLGENLVNEAMGAGKPFAPHGATTSEVQAWANLFRGTVGAFRNPQSHRDVKLSIEDAAAQLLTVNWLIRKLKADFPEKFMTEEERRAMTKKRKRRHAQTS
jgi:Protein of unknown function (Hypoth_ymh)